MKKNIVIFDFDGTIADTYPIIKTIIQAMARDYGYPSFTTRQFNRARQQDLQATLKQFKIPFFRIPFLLAQGRKKLYQLIEQVLPFKEIVEAVSRLRHQGLIIGILTSNAKQNVELFLKKHRLEVDFIDSELSLFGKHRALRKILKKHHWDKSLAIYVGDEVRDVKACQKIKMDVIAVSWGFNDRRILEKNHPTFIIDRPQELLKIISSKPMGSS